MTTGTKKGRTVTIPESDSDREMEQAIEALRAVVRWAQDEGVLKGASPGGVAEWCAGVLRNLGETP
jgi:hypothetical protein